MKKKVLSIILAVCLVLLPQTVSAKAGATPKAETVYVNLADDGKVNTIYVVNAFDLKSGGSITDFGNYKDLINLTDTSKISNSNGQISAQSSGNSFYYQGTLAKNALPWAISVEYFLDGKKLSADEIGGKNGAFELRIHIKNGDKKYQEFFERYMMQIAINLDKDICSNIVSEDATINTIGKTASISITHTMNTEATYSVTANVHDFEMGAITFRAAAMGGLSLDIDVEDSLLGGFDTLTDAVETLREGTEKLADGSRAFNKGLKTLNSKTGEFADGVNKLYKSAKTLNDAASQIADGSSKFATQLSALNSSLEASVVYSDGDIEYECAKTIIANGDDFTGTYQLAEAFLTQNATLTATKAGVSALNTAYGALDTGITQLQSGIDAVYSALGTIDGIVSNELVSGIATLASSYKKLHNGIIALDEGIVTLDEAVSEIPDTLKEKIDEFIESNLPTEGETVSFVSPDSVATSVMFVMQTEEIEKPPASVADAPAIRGPETFWEKLLNLFGLFRA